MMTKEEYKEKVQYYEYEIERNKELKCNRVAAKFERWLSELKEEYKDHGYDID